jgi:serine/threonine protein kinase
VAKKEAMRRQKSLRRDEAETQDQQHESWKDGFVKEITFQFQIKHANVVRLLGCCLETYVPILVFEFVSNGSLHDVLHVPHAGKLRELPLLKRLDIAIGSADGLSHMHELKHVHGDVKPANILLDEELNPKVSDFGSSKLLSVNRYARDVAADSNYADPVYHDTGRYTEKSDVYSFGVVLLELITRKTARYGDNGRSILAMDFKKACKNHGNGRDMCDTEILSGGHAHQSDHRRYMECFDMVGFLAIRCLNRDDVEVAMELREARDLKPNKLRCELKASTQMK